MREQKEKKKSSREYNFLQGGRARGNFVNSWSSSSNNY